MGQKDKKSVAQWLKEGRAAKGYTQQELSDLTGISLRSVQRIENGEVLPRQYSLRLLAEQLELEASAIGQDPSPEDPDDLRAGSAFPASLPPPSISSSRASGSTGQSHVRKIIVTIGLGLLLVLGTLAFLAQSSRFPETDFERILLWMAVAGVYFCVLYKIWK